MSLEFPEKTDFHFRNSFLKPTRFEGILLDPQRPLHYQADVRKYGGDLQVYRILTTEKDSLPPFTASRLIQIPLPVSVGVSGYRDVPYITFSFDPNPFENDDGRRSEVTGFVSPELLSPFQLRASSGETYQDINVMTSPGEILLSYGDREGDAREMKVVYDGKQVSVVCSFSQPRSMQFQSFFPGHKEGTGLVHLIGTFPSGDQPVFEEMEQFAAGKVDAGKIEAVVRALDKFQVTSRLVYQPVLHQNEMIQ